MTAQYLIEVDNRHIESDSRVVPTSVPTDDGKIESQDLKTIEAQETVSYIG